MTLKEKIKDVDIEKGMSDIIEQIADDYAIEFAYWLLTEKDETKTLREMLEMFKKEKGL